MKLIAMTAELVSGLGIATALVAVLVHGLQVPNASSLYLLAVAAAAIRRGTAAALITAVGGFLVYNFLFIEPRATFAVASAEEWLMLLLLLVVGLVIGRLAGRQRDREQEAIRRELESRALFAISRELATAHRLTDAARAVLLRIVGETGFSRLWIGIGATITQERVMADTAEGDPATATGGHAVLRRDPDEGAAAWTRIRPPAAGRSAPRDGGSALYRVELTVANEAIGSLWAERAASAADPGTEETRLLAAASDQLAQAVRRERLAVAAAEVEIDRRSEELRSAMLDSISHDLRTPLASIRAAAGSLADPAVSASDDERRATALAIDTEAERLNELVGAVLDMSRIQAGALVADEEVIPLGELVLPVAERMRERLASHPVSIDLPAGLPSVRADATFLTQAVTNLVENAVAHTPADAPISISAEERGDEVALTVEDGGPGVRDESIPHLFERFYRGPRPGSPARPGIGLGLSVVRGLVEAMDGSVSASGSRLGGLAVTILLPAAPDSPRRD